MSDETILRMLCNLTNEVEILKRKVEALEGRKWTGEEIMDEYNKSMGWQGFHWKAEDVAPDVEVVDGH